jgi:hypothetical protein
MANDNFPLLEVVVDTASAGDNIIIAGKAGNTIRVFQLFLVVGGDTLLTFKDGVAGTAFDGPLTMLKAGSITLDENDPHWFKTSLGLDFVINLSNPVQLSGRIYYVQSAPVI